jgi:hypothetical protein
MRARVFDGMPSRLAQQATVNYLDAYRTELQAEPAVSLLR